MPIDGTLRWGSSHTDFLRMCQIPKISFSKKININADPFRFGVLDLDCLYMDLVDPDPGEYNTDPKHCLY